MADTTKVKLCSALEPLELALQSLQQCAKEHKAFVIVQDTVTGRFVQFSGSNVEDLWFDAPQLGVVNNGPKFSDSREAAKFAIDALSLRHDLPGCADLEIIFESTQRGLPQ